MLIEPTLICCIHPIIYSIIVLKQSPNMRSEMRMKNSLLKLLVLLHFVTDDTYHFAQLLDQLLLLLSLLLHRKWSERRDIL